MSSTSQPVARVLAVCFDCADPRRVADFWRHLVGGEIELSTLSDDWVGLKSVPAIGHLGFQRVPEHKVVKNRVHLDLEVDDVEAAVRLAIGLGASRVGDVIDEGTNDLQVMSDVEGNEFCFIVRHPA